MVFQLLGYIGSLISFCGHWLVHVSTPIFLQVVTAAATFVMYFTGQVWQCPGQKKQLGRVGDLSLEQ